MSMKQWFSGLARRGVTRLGTGLAGLALCTSCNSGSDEGATASGANLKPPQPASCRIYAAGDIPGESQFLTAELQLASGTVLGPADPADRLKSVDGIAIHPTTRLLYAVAGRDGGATTSGASSILFQIDADTGRPSEIGPLGFASVRDLSFRPTDATLWTWVASTGLVQIDSTTGKGSLAEARDEDVVALAWTDDGATLYLAVKPSAG